MKSYVNWTSLLCGSSLLWGLVGCSSAQPSIEQKEDATVESTQGALAAAAFSTWTAWTMPVNVCFQSMGTTTLNQFNSLKAETLTTLAGSWGRVPGISFVDRGTCTASTPADYLHMKLTYVANQGCSCNFGVGATCDMHGSLDDAQQTNVYQGFAIHEVGHALGFHHEHKRVDSYDACLPGLAAACRSCKDKFDQGQSCSAADWNTCAQPQQAVTTPQYFPPGSSEYAGVDQRLIDNETDNSLELLTVFDPFSVMDYCRVPNGRSENDRSPTALDLLGAEMTYPANRNYPIGCQDRCFYSDSGVITRTDATLTTDWTTRGGLNVRLVSPVNGQTVNSFSTAGLSGGSSTLTFKFFAPRTNSQLTTSGTLMNSDAYHTALVASILPI